MDKKKFKKYLIDHLATEKLTGLTTDRENSNSGINCALWVCIKNYLQIDIFCIWCIVHTSNLV